jgi:hypothetical protein
MILHFPHTCANLCNLDHVPPAYIYVLHVLSILKLICVR